MLFVIQVKRVQKFRSTLLPLATISSKADIKCAIDRLSIISVPSSFPFVAALRMMPSFFDAYVSHSSTGALPDYRTRFNLTLFTTNISNLYCEDLSMTAFLGQHKDLAPLKFEDPKAKYRQFSALVLTKPLNIDISQVDLGAFVAISSEDFINLLSGLIVAKEELVCVTVTRTEAKFSGLTRQVIFKTEYSNCVIGGVEEGSVVFFAMTFNPKHFFYHIASGGKLVWIMKTVSGRNLLSCCLEIHASYLVCF